MKIILRLSSLGYGGTEQVYIELAKWLRSKGETVLFVVDYPGENDSVVKGLGFEIFFTNSKRSLFSIFSFVRVIFNYKPDVILSAYTFTNIAAFFSAKIAFWSNVSVLLSEHAPLKKHYQEMHWFKKKVLWILVRVVYPMSDGVICVSKGMAHEIESEFNVSNLEIINNPVRLFSFNGSKESSVDPSKRIDILAVGRICKAKDYLTLFRAIKLLKKDFNVFLKIVGGFYDKEYYRQLKLFVDENELNDCVSFEGYQSEIQNYYLNSDIFVNSSSWEGFGNVIVEAMHFGLPVVVTDCPYGPSEIVLDGEISPLVPVGDHDCLAKEIKNIITDGFNKDLLVSRSKDFEPDLICEKYYSLIKEVR